MTNRHKLKFSIFAAAVMALCLPMLAAAHEWWDRNGRYDDRYVRNSIHRLDRLAKDFEREVDRSLDRSRRDGTRREDRINSEATQFRDAVGDLKSSFGNGRNYRSKSRRSAKSFTGSSSARKSWVRSRKQRSRWFPLGRD